MITLYEPIRKSFGKTFKPSTHDEMVNKENDNISKLTIVASIKAKSDKIDLVKRELKKLIAITRAERVVSTMTSMDNDNPAHFYFMKIGSLMNSGKCICKTSI